MHIFTYWYWLLLVAVVSYIVGSISFAVIFSTKVKHADIRTLGSGNAGTTNMFRTFGIGLGFATFACDALKGVVCCVLTRLLFWQIDSTVMLTAEYIAGAFVVLGHIFSIFNRARGGKGVATTIGVMFTVQPILSLIILVPILLVILITDRMSVMAIALSVFLIVWHWLVLHSRVGSLACIAMTISCVMVIIAHRQNISRLLHRQEPPLMLFQKIFCRSNNSNNTDD